MAWQWLVEFCKYTSKFIPDYIGPNRKFSMIFRVEKWKTSPPLRVTGLPMNSRIDWADLTCREPRDWEKRNRRHEYLDQMRHKIKTGPENFIGSAKRWKKCSKSIFGYIFVRFLFEFGCENNRWTAYNDVNWRTISLWGGYVKEKMKNWKKTRLKFDENSGFSGKNSKWKPDKKLRKHTFYGQNQEKVNQKRVFKFSRFRWISHSREMFTRYREG